MARGVKVEEWKEKYILHNAHAMTAREMARALELSDVYIYNFCRRNGITPKVPGKTSARPMGQGVVTVKSSLHERSRHYDIEPEPIVKKPFKRPPAEYSNRSPFGIATEFNAQK